MTVRVPQEQVPASVAPAQFALAPQQPSAAELTLAGAKTNADINKKLVTHFTVESSVWGYEKGGDATIAFATSPPNGDPYTKWADRQYKHACKILEDFG
jgi:hypothetical protein